MRHAARLSLLGAFLVSALGACMPGSAGLHSYASDPDFTEPTFVSVQPVAYPHPTGCEMCGFTDRLGSPLQ